MRGRLGRGIRFGFDFFPRVTEPRVEVSPSEEWKPRPGEPWTGALLRKARRAPHSESQVTLKLVPSLLREDGVASFAPAVLTMIDSCTPVPKLPIAPEFVESVA